MEWLFKNISKTSSLFNSVVSWVFGAHHLPSFSDLVPAWRKLYFKKYIPSGVNKMAQNIKELCGSWDREWTKFLWVNRSSLRNLVLILFDICSKYLLFHGRRLHSSMGVCRISFMLRLKCSWSVLIQLATRGTRKKRIKNSNKNTQK